MGTEGFFRTCLHVDLDDLAALASAVNEGPLLGNRFVTSRVEIPLFSGWVAVVPKHDLPGASHASLRTLMHPPRILPQPLSSVSLRKPASAQSLPSDDRWHCSRRPKARLGVCL